VEARVVERVVQRDFEYDLPHKPESTKLRLIDATCKRRIGKKEEGGPRDM
jgi:hypothetical protein